MPDPEREDRHRHPCRAQDRRLVGLSDQGQTRPLDRAPRDQPYLAPTGQPAWEPTEQVNWRLIRQPDLRPTPQIGRTYLPWSGALGRVDWSRSARSVDQPRAQAFARHETRPSLAGHSGLFRDHVAGRDPRAKARHPLDRQPRTLRYPALSGFRGCPVRAAWTHPRPAGRCRQLVLHQPKHPRSWRRTIPRKRPENWHVPRRRTKARSSRDLGAVVAQQPVWTRYQAESS
ncbi:hypothetical protein SAMN05443432_1095 [Roseovarius litoreus]|uniref:Uncharacterized protein n=1 Tax=Roseovarius litoreus TaxID=1155722 RepID=A0A1M7JMW8_9RHOB|nr:hypothetical protein SAMN05443432_1095 [Roseovarius litoreus]